MRAACYVRVSRADQRTELQRDETSALIAARGWTPTRTFSDEGISGAKARRPGVLAMIEAARRREFDVLVVYRADRLFRSLRDLVNTLDDLTRLGVQFVSVTEPQFDMSTASGRMIVHVLGAVAEFERGVLRERTRDALAAARRRGVRLGRREVPIDVRKVRALYAGKVTVRAIARQLETSAGKVHSVLASYATPGAFGREALHAHRSQASHPVPIGC